MSQQKYALVVDDNPSDIFITKILLEKDGFLPVPAKDGFEALDLLDKYLISLFVIDLQMPKMSGSDLVNRIRHISIYEKTPILIASARNEMKDVKNAIEKGASDYVIKPLDAAIFNHKLMNLKNSQQEEWFEYTIPADSSLGEVWIQEKRQLLSLNEVQFTLLSKTEFKEGTTIAVGGEIFKGMGMPEMLGRVLHTRANAGGFETTCSYVGINEELRQKIRVLCRSLWTQKEKSA